MPTRPKSSRSVSQHASSVRSPVVCPSVCSRHASKSNSNWSLSRRELTVPQAMVVVPVFVEQGKEGDDLTIRAVGLGDPKPVLQHPSPVDNAVVATYRQDIAVEDGRHEHWEVMHRREFSATERHRSPAAAAGETLTLEIP